MKQFLIGVGILIGSIAPLTEAQNYQTIRAGLDLTWQLGDRSAVCSNLKSLGYNYVVVPLDQTDPGGLPQNQYMTDWLDAAGSQGLKVIPYFGLAQGRCNSWGPQFKNSNVQTNWYQSPFSPHEMLGCHEFAPNKDNAGNDIGMDLIFNQLLDAFTAAYARATRYVDKNNVKLPIDYIHIGHDEFAYGWEGVISIGGQQPAKNPPQSETYSKLDRDYIENLMRTKNTSLTQAFQILICNEIYRKLKLVRSHFPLAKVLLWGDAFDPQHNGGSALKTYYSSEKITLCPGILTLPGLNPAEASEFKARVIFIPWHYNTWAASYAEVLKSQKHPYSAEVTFDSFKKNGFKFMFNSAFDGLVFPRLNGIDWPDTRQAMRNFALASKSSNYSDYCVGYCAATYRNGNGAGLVFKELQTVVTGK